MIDWRGSRYNCQKDRNCFHDFFKPRETLGGIPAIAGDEVAAFDFPTPIYPDKWSPEALAAVAHVPHTAVEIATTEALVDAGKDRPEPTIVINQAVDANLPYQELRKVLADLEFVDEIAEKASIFQADRMQDKPFIGLHIRHGNGENIGNRVVYWLDDVALIKQLKMNKNTDIHSRTQMDGDEYADRMPPSLMARSLVSRSERRLYDSVAERIREVRRIKGLDTPVFLCTDAQRVISGIEDRVGDVITYPKTMLAEGKGPLHQTKVKKGAASDGAVGRDLIEDMLIETELLRRCCSIICIPSQFSLIPRVELAANAVHLLKPSLVNRIISKLFD